MNNYNDVQWSKEYFPKEFWMYGWVIYWEYDKIEIITTGRNFKGELEAGLKQRFK